MTDDAELLRRYVAEKSDAAFTELVNRHLGFVYQTALRHLQGDAHAAQDVAQLVFTDLARKAPSLLHRPLLAGWLHTGTRYAALQRIRGEQRRQRRELEAQRMDEMNSPGPAVDWDRLRPVIDEALHALNRIDREAVLMRFFEGRDFAEVGARLELSARAARARVERAVDRMQAHLARRGVTSSAAALSLALASQPLVGAPAGLAQSIAGSALEAGAPGGIAGVLTLGTIGLMKVTSLVLAVSVAANVGIALVLFHDTASAAVSDATGRLQSFVDRPTRTGIVEAPGPGLLTDPAAIGRRLRADGFSDDVIAAAVREATREQDRNSRRDEIAAREARIRRWNTNPQDSIAVAPVAGLRILPPGADENPAVARQREQALAALGLDESGKRLESLYRGIPPDKARLVRQIETDYNDLRMNNAEARGSALLDREFQRDVLAVLNPEEATSWLRYSSNAARQVQRALAGVDAPEASYHAIVDATVEAERAAWAAGRSFSQYQLGLFETYRRELGDDRFLGVTRNLGTSGHWMPIDAIYEQAALPATSRVERFLVTYEVMTANRLPGADRSAEAQRARAALTAGLDAAHTAAFDASVLGQAIAQWMRPPASAIAGQ